MSYLVYLHTNRENGKKYVGITSQKSGKRRWHNGEGYKKQRRFYSAITCYGWDGFTHEILFSGLTKEQAEEKEEQLIKLFRSNELEHGYNIENGGKTHRMSEAQKQRLREVQTGRKLTEETKRKISESHKGLSPSWLTGRTATAETRAKMSVSRSGKRNGRARSVLQFSFDGILIEVYATLKDAANAVNVKSSAHISQCCSGERNCAYGFCWAYAEVN